MLSETFRSDMDAFARSMRAENPLILAAQSGKVGPNAMAAYLATLAYLLRHNVPSLAMAKEYALIAGKNELASYYDRKLGEERGHYRWAEQDLAKLGTMFGVVTPRDPLAPAQTFLGDLRAALADNPTCFLSYIICAEYITVVLGPVWLQLLETRCNIPRTAVTAVDNHIELDKDHAEHGLEMLDELVRSEDDVPALMATLRRFMEFLDSLTRRVAEIPN